METDCFNCDRGLTHFSKALEVLLKSPQSYDRRIRGAEMDGQYNDFCSSFKIHRKLLFKNSSLKQETFTWDELKQCAQFDEYFIAEFHDNQVKVKCENDALQMKDKLKELCQSVSLDSPTLSLQLISLEKYEVKYRQLKEKYYVALKESWCERTDPEKFIPEDLGIASYLLCLWEEERKELGIDKLQSFVDLGCGNGLLVYLLHKEGHPGTGLDVRKRKIWDLFADIDLQENTIIPSVETTYSGYDWLIGNHSDELTPWIPVMSTLTSENTRFFVLPCCPFEFYSKFKRRNHKLGMYTDYLNYVEEVCRWTGFSVERDRLRIPSTKRVCFVGRKRNSVLKWSQLTQNIKEKLVTENSTFKPRDKIEKVRNCTQVDKTVLNQIVNIIVGVLLSKNGTSKEWNGGTSVPISSLVQKIPSDLLNLLKSECGGLQTLLRNHHYIFFVSKGCVRFRIPGKDNPVKKSNKVKTKLCWFYSNHPDGCPASEKDCLWIHPDNEAE
ncbi:probable tRNA (uracil-O(2)-)-methyltransferase isoform X1 [Lepeophtheirus salmonis]|uniref:probable tRNA (uracil-O(2)-)-methyltransferase isoform X1 n=1 Tax=Lepeophtheirus salmonis TaxID=72036 RepID=UPI001AEB7F92|nr:probable tRNA (uracil-O(2)-)-methyltransferase isoform X1 [Lepeophtheirus salmonis]